jgi:hypothetical protein
MRVARCPVRITLKSEQLEGRRRRVARAQLKGVPVPATAKALGVCERTVYRDRREIRSWVAQVAQLAKFWDSISEHQARMQRVLEGEWGRHAVGYTRLRARLLHAMCQRRDVIEPPLLSLTQVEASLKPISFYRRGRR